MNTTKTGAFLGCESEDDIVIIKFEAGAFVLSKTCAEKLVECLSVLVE